MTQCQRCGAAMADDARFCPSCGNAVDLAATFPPTFGPPLSRQSISDYLVEPIGDGFLVRNLPRGIALFVALIGFFAAAWIQTHRVPATATETSSPTPTASSRAPIAISAADLWRAYDANEARAQATYGPGPLLVTGTVDSIGINFDKSPSVSLVTPNNFMSAHVELIPADHPRALQLNKGDKITVDCATASITLGSPFLHDCTFLPAPKSQK